MHSDDLMNLYLKILVALAVALAGVLGYYLHSGSISFGGQPAITTFEGGTGSTSPSGILYGDSSIRLKTVVPGANCSFSGGVFNCTSGGGTGSGTVSTSTALVSGQVDFSTGVSTIGNDSTFLFSTALERLTALNASTTAFTAVSSYLGTVLSGIWNGTTIAVANGGTGQTTLGASQLLYGQGTGGVQSVATTTLTATSPLALSQPVVKVGGSNSALTLDTSGTWSGNAGTATALAANGTNCSAGSFPLGVDASGNSESCTVATTGTVTSVATNNGITGGTITTTGTLGLATIATGNVLANGTSGTTFPSAVATSTLYGVWSNGNVLGFSGGNLIGLATTSISAGTAISTSVNGSVTTVNVSTVPVANGGTNSTSFAPSSIIVSNAAANALVATSSSPLYVSSINATSTSLYNGFFGTSTPYAALSINAPAMGTAPYIAIGSTTGEVFNMTASAFPQYVLGASTTPSGQLAINPTALIGANSAFIIGSTSSLLFQVTNGGKIYAPNTASSGASQTGYWCYDAAGQLIRDTAVCLVSALKFKKDVQTLTEVGLPDLLTLRPVSYHYKDSSFGANLQIGFIADEIASSSPFLNETLVVYDSQGAVHGFNYETFTALITKSIQDFYKEFQTLVARVTGLEGKVNAQQAQIDTLQHEIDDIKNSR